MFLRRLYRSGRVMRRASRLLTLLAATCLTVNIVTLQPASAGAMQVFAWGINTGSQLGNCANGTYVPTPATVFSACTPNSAMSGVTKIAAGSLDSLALLSNGTVMGWGNDVGICMNSTGSGYTTDAVPLTNLPTNSAVVGIATSGGNGNGFSLFLLQNGTVWACGDNSYSELGYGVASSSTNYNTTPQEVLDASSGTPLTGVKRISAGLGYGLALLTNGSIMAWGDNQYGELGDGVMTGNATCLGLLPCQTEATPTLLPAGDKATAISAGTEHSLALLSTARVLDWGYNYQGQLGDGLYTGTNACASPTQTGVYCDPNPVKVIHVRDVIAIASGDGDSLALLQIGKVKAWGSDESGELGSKLGLPNAAACPNANYGQQCSATAVTILSGAASNSPPLTGVRAISAGSGPFQYSDFNLALLANGTVDAWGDNYAAELGTTPVAGSPTPGCGPNANEPCSDAPLAIAGLSSIVAISAQGGAGVFGLALTS